MRYLALLAVLVLTIFTACAGETEPATNVDHDSATLNGEASCDQGDSGSFRWMLSTAGGPFVQVGDPIPYNCTSAIPTTPINKEATGLTPQTSYRYRLEVDAGAPGGGWTYTDTNGGMNPSSPVYDGFTTTTAPPPPPPPPPSGFPTAATTGVPAGWTPTATTTGNLTVTTNGTVIDGRRVTGSIFIRAQNVTVRNSEVYGQIYNQVANQGYNGLLVEDTTIGPPSGVSGETTGALGVGGYTARRVHIRNTPEGFRVGGYSHSGNKLTAVRIEDSYVKLVVAAGTCPHGDGIQEYDWGPRLDINHNTIDMRGNSCSTAPIYLNDPGLKTVTNNLIMGGSYTLRLHGPGTFERVTGNRLVDGAWDYGPVLINDGASCGSIGDWSDNTLVNIDSSYRVTSTVRALTNC